MFKLTDKQLEAQKLIAAFATYIMLFGGSRSGKTFLHVRNVVMRALKAPGSRHCILRFRFNHIKSSIVFDTFPKVMKIAFPNVEWKLDKVDWYVKFPNGSEIWFGGLDDKQRTEKILGNEYASIYLNECSQISWQSVGMVITRLAQQSAQNIIGREPCKLKTRMYFDCNPPNKLHWTYLLFVKKVDPETKEPLRDPENYVCFKMNPSDNVENLSDGYLETLQGLSARLRKRFLDGDFADANPNAMFSDETIEKWRVIDGVIPELIRVVIAVDPSGADDTHNEENDAIGIVAAGLGIDGNVYILEDCTVKAGPAIWGRVATSAYDRLEADAIVAETNYGGAMVKHTIQVSRPKTPFQAVTASRGKHVRADPISALYEEGKVRHVGYFNELEEELSGFSTMGYLGDKSPNRADALIWAVTALFPGATRKQEKPHESAVPTINHFRRQGVIMARKTKDEVLLEVHNDALAEFSKIQSAVRNERLQCLQDRRFYSIAGAQWEGPLGLQFENKPKFEVNKIHLAVIRIINEYRNNRISVIYSPKDGSKSDKLADTCNGLYRADEQDSTAEEAYDNAFEEAVGGGFGAWRLRADYEDEEDEEDDKQRIRIEPILDADSSVFFDLDAKRQDKADAKKCYVLTSMSRQAYIDEYNDDPSSWPKVVHQSEFDWLTPDIVYIAEYYKVEKYSETMHIYRGLDGQEERYCNDELDDDEIELLEATGFREVRQKKVKRTRIHKYIMSGGKILEDCGYIAGKCIPVIVVYGKRWFIDNVERCMGHVRLAKDISRLKNMQLSKLGEISALSTVEKPIFTPEQMAGHAVMWAEDNIKNYPYLLLNPMFDASGTPVANGPIAYTKTPQIPPAMAALLQITEQDIQDILGNQEAGEQLQNSVSGIAVELVQNKLDMQTFIYISNMAKAVKRSGEIWLSMAKEILVEEGRKMKTINEAGESSSIELLRSVIDAKSGAVVAENDLSNANFEVSVEVGPTSSSKRSATVRGLTGMMQITQDPQTLDVLSSMAMMNMEGEGIGEVRDYFRNKLIRMGVVKPTEEEAQQLQAELANQQPDPNAKFLEASAKEAEAKAIKTMAETELTGAKIEETRANAASIAASIDIEDRKHIVDILTKLNERQQPQGV